MQPTWTDEDRLCLLAAVGRQTPSEKDRLKELLGRPLDWNRVVARALQHQIYPSPYRNLREYGDSKVPKETQRLLEAHYRTNAFRNTLLAEEMAGILLSLQKAGVAALPLKGLPLAERIYGDRSFRACADIDILVPRPELTAAYDLLAARGYAAQYSRDFLSDRITRNTYEFPMIRATRMMVYPVELHCGLLWEMSAETGSASEVWKTVEACEFHGSPAFRMSHEWEFLFLVIHAARHRWGCLKWLVDIHELCKREEFDWTKVRNLAVQMGWERVVEQTLIICRGLLGTSAPPAFDVQEDSPADLQNLHRYFTAPEIPTPMQNTLLCMSLVRSPVAKIRFFFRRLLVPTPRDAALCRLPVSLNFLYYLLRPVRLGLKAFAALLRIRPAGGG